LYYDISFKQF